MSAAQLAGTGGAIGHSKPRSSYRLLQRLAHGGMATVYRAVQAMPSGVEREIVIKRVKSQFAHEPAYVQMFLEEARLGALLNHPHLVQTFDLQLSPRGYFMTMEFVDGVSLLQVFRHRAQLGPLPLPTVAAIIVQLLEGLHHAHNVEYQGRPLGLVHRDVSPANVMISRQGVVKLLDFGIAKPLALEEREETHHGTLKGKYAYMSPEQVSGEPLSPRSDIFVAGTLLWEALTGRRLFRGRTDYHTLMRICEADVPAPSTLRPDIPAALDAICLKALARDPQQRFHSAEQMSDALDQQVLADAPVYPSDLAALVAQVQGPIQRKVEPTSRRQPTPLAEPAEGALPHPAVVTRYPTASAMASVGC